MNLRVLWARLKGLTRRREFDGERQKEIASHLELAAAENLRRGMPLEEARRLAAVRFGSVTSAKELVWDESGLPGLASCLQDARYAFRDMRESDAHGRHSVVARLSARDRLLSAGAQVHLPRSHGRPAGGIEVPEACTRHPAGRSPARHAKVLLFR